MVFLKLMVVLSFFMNGILSTVSPVMHPVSYCCCIKLWFSQSTNTLAGIYCQPRQLHWTQMCMVRKRSQGENIFLISNNGRIFPCFCNKQKQRIWSSTDTIYPPTDVLEKESPVILEAGEVSPHSSLAHTALLRGSWLSIINLSTNCWALLLKLWAEQGNSDRKCTNFSLAACVNVQGSLWCRLSQILPKKSNYPRDHYVLCVCECRYAVNHSPEAPVKASPIQERHKCPKTFPPTAVSS